MVSLQRDRTNDWAFQEQADQRVAQLLGTIPGRWGRMTPMSRLLVVEVAQLVAEKKLLESGKRFDSEGLVVGLVGGSARGSLHTDLAFINTMEEGPGMASPALFGYTLPNIPLAEAASHFGLTGPVYAIFATDDPCAAACEEARRLLTADAGLHCMLACGFEHRLEPLADGPAAGSLFVNLTLIER